MSNLFKVALIRSSRPVPGCRNFGKSHSSSVFKILQIPLADAWYVAVAFTDGFVCLYRCIPRHSTGTVSKSRTRHHFLLVREFTNSFSRGSDEFVAVGSLDHYLYTCSRGGRLVIRDLVNDDSNIGISIHYVDAPVVLAQLFRSSTGRDLWLATSGTDNCLRVRKINRSPLGNAHLGPSNLLVSPLYPLPRRDTVLNVTQYGTQTAYPQQTDGKPTGPPEYGEIYWHAIPDTCLHSREENTASLHWILSVEECNICRPAALCAYTHGIVCGTHFGLLVHVGFDRDRPGQSLQVSRFPVRWIKKIQPCPLMLYSDGISKIGIIRPDPLDIICQYDGLGLGPTIDLQVVCAPVPPLVESNRYCEASPALPIFVLALRYDSHLVVLKLCANGRCTQLFDGCVSKSPITNLCVLGKDAYSRLARAFTMPKAATDACDRSVSS